MWEMLITKMDYKPENVYVLFADGEDFWVDPLHTCTERYTPQYYKDKPGYEFIGDDYQITENEYNDGAATLGNLQQLTGELQGKLKNEDFLFVWTFDHGGRYYDSGKAGSYLCLLDGNIKDYQFAELFNPIPALKKVYWMQQCYGGGFEYSLTHDVNSALTPQPILPNVYFHSASQKNQPACRADNQVRNKAEYKTGEITVYGDEDMSYGDDVGDFDQPFVYEADMFQGEVYTHGEFNYLMYSASMGHNPYFNKKYYDDFVFLGVPYEAVHYWDADGLLSKINPVKGAQFCKADCYIDGLITIDETSTFEKVMESITIETPVISDYSEIGISTSLKYPTVLYCEVNTDHLNGNEIRGIAATATISNSISFLYDKEIMPNSSLIIRENNELNAMVAFTINSSSIISGENNNIVTLNDLTINSPEPSEINGVDLTTENLTILPNSILKLTNGTKLNVPLDKTTEIPAYSHIGAMNGAQISGNYTFGEGSSLTIASFSSLSIGEGSHVVFSPNTQIKLGQSATLIIEENATLELSGPMKLYKTGLAKIIVKDGGYFITEGNIDGEIGVSDVDPLNKNGEWNGIKAESGSVIQVRYTNFTGAETAIYGTGASILVKNSTFTNCAKGIFVETPKMFEVTKSNSAEIK